MKNLSRLILIFSLGLLAIPAKAQDTTQVNDNYDPIAANLDSLVTLNYIQRLNFADAGANKSMDFEPHDIPSYSHSVYSSRIAKIQSPIMLAYNDEVREYIDLYAIKRRQLTARVMGLADLYFPMFEEALDKNNLPLELKYLAIVESALNPTAVSRMGATGIWQFMLGTGKMYNLKVNSYIDERRDPVKATYAACEYFKNMYEIYKDWLLVIAAYNCGPGNVNKAIVRSGGKTTFWEISQYLPRETRGYVPAFCAVTYLMHYTKEHNITAVPPVISFYEVDTVYVDQKVSFKDISTTLNIPLDMLQYLNPLYKRGVIPDGDDSYVLRLPVNKITAYLNNCDKFCPPLADGSATYFAGDDGSLDPTMFVKSTIKKYHTVKKRETLASIAKKYHCAAGDIKRWNKMKGSKVYRGQKLMVYATTYQKAEQKAEAQPDTLKTPATADTAKKSTPSPEGNASKVIYHVVNRGDTLWNIAQRYEVTVQKLKELNKLNNSNQLKPGTRLKVVVNG
jgi:membrane-bound lytic murein transglycosylase D